MSAIKQAAPPQAAGTPTDAPSEVLTMRGLWLGLLIAAPVWLMLALLVLAVY